MKALLWLTLAGLFGIGFMAIILFAPMPERDPMPQGSLRPQANIRDRFPTQQIYASDSSDRIFVVVDSGGAVSIVEVYGGSFSVQTTAPQ